MASSSLANRQILAWILGAIALLVAVSLTAYRDAPANGFHFDDFDNIVNHPPVRMRELGAGELAKAWSEPLLAYRPLPSLTFAMDWWRGQGSPRPFQQTNVALHALNSLIVFALILAASRAAGRQANGAAVAAAAAGAALWALHPIQVQAVTYVVQRMTLLAAGFMFLSVFAYVRARSESPTRRGWLALAFASAGLGAVSKEIAWMTPFLWWLAEFGLCRRDRPIAATTLDKMVFALPFLAAVLVIADVASGRGPISHSFVGSFDHRDFTMADRLLTQPRVILFHLSQIAWPLPDRFSVEHDFAISRSLVDPATTLLAIAVVFAWCVAGLLCLRSVKWRLAGFWMLWIPTTLAVESSFVPLEMVFEHRMYVPSAAVFGLLAAGLAWLPGVAARTAALCACAAAAAFLLWATQQRVPAWRDDLTLYERALDHAPGSSRLWQNYGTELVKRGRLPEAEKALRQALELDPEDPVALEALGVIMMDKQDYTAADRHLRRALELRGGHHSILNHLGEVYMQVGNIELAADQFANAVAAAPYEPAYRWNLAVALERLGRCAPAREQWAQYLRYETSAADRAVVEQHLREQQGPGGCVESRAEGRAE